VQIARTGKFRTKIATVAWFKRDLKKPHQLPLLLIGLAMLSYAVIVWQWL
jgi:hypothetical protein